MKPYEIIFITNLPAFYKLNLFNRIAEYKKILVVFTHEHSKQRNADFYTGEKKFDYLSIAKNNLIGKIITVHKLIKNTRYDQLILGGWDQYTLWYAAFLGPRLKNALIVESSIYDSETTGMKGWIKKVIIQRASIAYVSGKSQADLCVALGFTGKLVKTKGVGIFNVLPQPAFQEREAIKNFLYVGRLSQEKNLPFLIETFYKLPNLRLFVVGFGPQEEYLKSRATKNVIFLGPIANRELHRIYQQNDVFILPSLSEPWGIVVEEALNNGLPVIVSDRVGCAEEIVDETNGIVFKLNEPDSLLNTILKIQDVEFHNSLRKNISKMNFEKIAKEQVNCYL